jgi:hypothetical protein
MMYQMTAANTIANAMNMPVFNGLLLIAANAFVAKADAAALAAAMRPFAGGRGPAGSDEDMVLL